MYNIVTDAISANLKKIISYKLKELTNARFNNHFFRFTFVSSGSLIQHNLDLFTLQKELVLLFVKITTKFLDSRPIPLKLLFSYMWIF